MVSSSDRRKVLVFGVLGALGCLCGWGLGEGFLAAVMPRVEQSEAAPSLASKPVAAPIATENQITSPPPPLPALTQVQAPPPPADFKERLDRWGAKTGDVQLSLFWSNINDLDLHCIEPSGNEIYFGKRLSPSGGELDIDKNLHDNEVVTDPVENIFWPKGRSPVGRYQVFVRHYRRRASDPTAYRVSVLVDDERQEFTGSLNESQVKAIHEFTLTASLRLPGEPTKTSMLATLTGSNRDVQNDETLTGF